MNCDKHNIPLKKRTLSAGSVGKPLWYCDKCEEEEKNKKQLKEEVKEEKDIIKKSTALGKAYAALGISDWDEVFPKAICDKCYLSPNCNRRCAALSVIGGLAIQASFSAIMAHALVIDIKDVLKLG